MADLTEEGFGGGLVTSQDPSTLEPGELTIANNAIYQPSDQAIHKVKGRTKYNAVALGAAGNVKGVRYLEFDDGTSIIAAHESDDIHLSTFSSETGTFVSLTPISNIGSGSSMDGVHYNNKHYLLIGAGQNQVVETGGVNRKHGMAPVPELITAPANVAGAWSSPLGPGYYHFLYTEVVKDTLTGEEIESTFTGNPRSVNITTVSSQQVTITRNGVIYNTGTTLWRVYMAGPTVSETPIPLLSDFRLVAEQDITNTTASIGNQTLTGTRIGTANTTQVAGWSNVSNVFSDTDGVGMRSNTLNSSEFIKTFGFSGISGTITGFEVYVRFKTPDFFSTPILRSASHKIIIDISHNGTNFFPGGVARYILCRAFPGAVASYVTDVQGNPYDLWGRSSWALGDVNGNASFGVRITLGNEYSGDTASIVDIDWVKIAVYSTGSNRPVNLEGKPFRVVSVSEAGITTVYPANMPPPVATTGDIFEDQMILNDPSDTSLIRASLPGYVEGFPAPYFVNFETKDRDEVTCVRVVGNKVVIGMTHQLYRLNYFPRETDAEFDRGRCYEAISEHHGIVGPMAATIFSPDGGSILLAMVGVDGLFATDAYQLRHLSDDLDWDNLLRAPTPADVTNYKTGIHLVNYPILHQLWMYFTPYGQTTNTQAMVFHYHRSHVKPDGNLKATGPIDVATFSACLARLAGQDVILTGQSGGFVYLEDRGYDNGSHPFVVQTREMYPGGLSGQITMNSTYVRHRSDSPVSTVTVTPITRNGSSAQVTQTAKTFTNTNGGAAYLPWTHIFNSLQMKLSEPGANGGGAVRLTNMALELTGHGLPESRA
jgi:hypothetical protein